MSESFRQLRHVLALYEHRNYRRAAEALHLTQSALSVSIRRIEDEYGVPLFIRDQAGVRPTEYGEVVVIRLKQSITPGTVVTPPLPPEVRYWSLCQYHVSTTAVLSCLSDRDVITQADGEQVIVLSPIVLRPAFAVASRGYNWMEYGSKPNEILGLRQLLPHPDFAGNFLKAIAQPEVPVSATLGEYAPDITYCDKATFDAYALQGAQAVMAACKLATAAAK